MTKPLLHFTHGNSYPAGAYRQYLDHLRADFDVRAVDMHGHDPQFPVTDGWHELVAELVSELERYPSPAILVGHSLGGMLSLLAAEQRPELVRCVVMLDSPVVAGWRAWMWRVIKRLGHADRFSPAKFSRRRRSVWPSREAAHAHFSAKEMFAAWAPGVLEDYIEHGLEAHPEGVTLRFSPEVETEIYNSLPHHMGSVATPRFPLPVGFVAGTNSVELRQAGRGATLRLVGDNFVEIEGSHLFPMESPELTAELTRAMIGKLLA